MTEGIFNPHVKKKAKPAPPVREDAFDDLRAKPHLDLDGDSYVIRFEGRDNVKRVAEELIKLLYAVNKTQQAHLEQNGIWVDTGDTPTRPDTMALKNENNRISVYTTEPYEVEIFRRIGYTLYTLPDKTLLRKHRVKLIRRG